MHSLFSNLGDELAEEQRRNAQTQRKIFEMMHKLEEFVLEGATTSCKNIGVISQQLSKRNACTLYPRVHQIKL